MTTTPTRRVLTPLDPETIDKRPPFTGGRPQMWEALSVGGVWHYLRVEVPGTPWRVEHRPSGRDLLFTTLSDARAWTGDEPAAIGHLRAEATRVLLAGGFTGALTCALVNGRLQRVPEDPQQAWERAQLARRAIAVYDGRLRAGDPDARCTCAGESCGGFLLEEVVADGACRWVTADVCVECIGESPAARLRCRTLHRHQPCADADPVQCAHVRCSAVARPVDAACRSGLEACCWCCGDD